MLLKFISTERDLKARALKINQMPFSEQLQKIIKTLFYVQLT